MSSSKACGTKIVVSFTTPQERRQKAYFLAVLNAMEQVPNVDVFK